MGFGLNLRPAPLRGTNAGFFQMSVSQYHEWKIVSWQEKEHVNLATEEAIVSKKFHFHWASLFLEGELINHDGPVVILGLGGVFVLLEMHLYIFYLNLTKIIISPRYT